MSDPRFERLKTDPRFRKPRRKQNRVVVDDRFKSVFESKGKNKAKRIDKYGRKVAADKDTDNLKRFYRLEDENDEMKLAAPDYARGEVLMESSSEEEEYEKAGEDDSGAEDRIVTLGANARKPISVPNEEPEVDLDESQFAELDELAETSIAKDKEKNKLLNVPGQQTNRLAAVNLDWDHVRAIHLYKIFTSALTPNNRDKGAPMFLKGKVLNVRIYPSQLGKERMERENIEGPPSEIFKKQSADGEYNTSVIEEDDGKEYEEEALRKYQLERLRYYYAIVTCDTVETAARIYSELDGTELERSANLFDLSYVPNDMTFDEEFTDEATQDVGPEYKGLEFSTDALRHSRVKLTWDNDDPERAKLTKRALSKKEIDEIDFKAYIASSESEDGDEEDKNAARDRLRALLLGAASEASELVPEGWGKDRNKTGEMEITFTPGLSAKSKVANEEEETTMQTYLRRQREKRKKRKAAKDEKAENADQATNQLADEFFGEDSDQEADVPIEGKKGDISKNKKRDIGPVARQEATVEELEYLVANTTNEPKHFNMKSILKAEKAASKKARKRFNKKSKNDEGELQEDFEIDVNDGRFKSLHEDHEFAIDPSNPHFKKTKNMATLLEERGKRQRRQSQREEINLGAGGRDEGSRSLNSLVENVKRKSAVAFESGRNKRLKV